MHIRINDEPRVVASAVLADILVELGYGDARVATAVDGAFVPVSRRGDYRLREDARLEIVAPMQGG